MYLWLPSTCGLVVNFVCYVKQNRCSKYSNEQA